MTTVSRANGWTVDTKALTLAWSDVGHPASPLPDMSLGALVYFGLGYLESQAAARSVSDKFRKAKLEELRRTNPDAKAGDGFIAQVPVILSGIGNIFDNTILFDIAIPTS